MEKELEQRSAQQTVFVNELTNGILDPTQPMLGPVRQGGFIVANTAPGCWGPMLTPAIRGGHEVTRPVAVEGAEVGDAIVIRIKDISITSMATASGTDAPVEGRFVGDPFIAVRCPECGTLYPETRIEGIGGEAIHCANCGAEVAPFRVTNGYTVAFNAARTLGVTVDKPNAEKIAHDARKYSAVPDCSVQNPILTVAPSDLAGMVLRLRPFMGQLGTTPPRPWPDSHNAGDLAPFMVNAPHEYAIDEDMLEQRTDGHLDCDAVRAGAILICPVKTPGGGVYMGDMHALQGDGEIAGHTSDVSGTVTLHVDVIKGLELDGPVLLPVQEDLPFLARPLSAEETKRARELAAEWGMGEVELTAPISVIGSGPNLNAATDNGLERAAKLLGVSVEEVKNRATVTGSIEIARHPGVAQVTFRAPLARLDELGLGALAREQYQLVE